MVGASARSENAAPAASVLAPMRPAGLAGVLRRWWPVALFAVVIVLAETVLFGIRDEGGIFWGYRRPRHGTGPFLVAIFAAFVATGLGIRIEMPPIARRRAALAIAAASAMLAALVGSRALRSFPNSGDEYAYLFQSWTYAAGRLWNPPPPLGQLMASHYAWVTATKWAGQYGPGWPLAMIPAIALGLPGWTTNLALLAAAILLLFDLASRRAGAGAAMFVTLVFALSPFTLFNAASFFPHLLVATLALLACWAADRVGSAEGGRWAMLAGAAIGMVGITRPVSALILVLPILIAVLRKSRLRRPLPLWVALGGAPFLLGLFWYQWRLTGSPWTPVYYLGGRSVDHLYFDPPSIWRGITLTVGRLRALCLWVSPAMAPLWLAALAIKLAKRRADAFDLIFPLTIMVFVFYPFMGGNQYGPRYYFDTWPLALLTIATALPLMSPRLRSGAQGLMLLTILYGAITLAFLAPHFRDIVDGRAAMYRSAEALPPGRRAICFFTGSGLSFPLETEDLARNGTAATGAIVYARCGAGVPQALRLAFPDRRIWLYRRVAGAPNGRFVPYR